MAVPKPTEKIYGPDEAIAKGIMSLLHSPNTKILSDLDDEEILNLSLLMMIGNTIKSEVIKGLCENFLQLRVSRYRLGRREMVSVARSSEEPDRKKAKGIKDLFSGLR
jgi:flagellar motor switch protein FliG